MKHIFICCCLGVLLAGCATYNGESQKSNTTQIPGYQYKPDKSVRMEYVKKHPEFQSIVKMAIESGQVILGMSKEQLKIIYGEPCATETGATGYESWGYNYGYKDSFMIGAGCSLNSFYFKDGKIAFLTSIDWQNSQNVQTKPKETTPDERRKVYVQKNKQLSVDFKKAILSGKVILGMTPEDVSASWGKPEDVNKSGGAWGVHEQWVYGLKTYLYFENDKLTNWQN